MRTVERIDAFWIMVATEAMPQLHINGSTHAFRYWSRITWFHSSGAATITKVYTPHDDAVLDTLILEVCGMRANGIREKNLLGGSLTENSLVYRQFVGSSRISWTQYTEKQFLHTSSDLQQRYRIFSLCLGLSTHIYIKYKFYKRDRLHTYMCLAMCFFVCVVNVKS